ncbi:hypothetical protein SAMN06265222_11658 [Neorhodopirellula lusitana]|uniref:Secreted protein n=1 Tax=Neorhodopirellula lusitana TaxID=445327 RepID=A0ABY1QKB3_9BACT|nr:hypothetical protein [Neorhodopirellula lusitana]SMP73218.1 hypothetical protein SAMN06265222_11658 [Neorhodopirellula lusitana]
MKPICRLFVALVLFAPVTCLVGCGSNEPINVTDGQSKEDLAAQSAAIAEEYDRMAEQDETLPPTAEEKAMNAGR